MRSVHHAYDLIKRVLLLMSLCLAVWPFGISWCCTTQFSWSTCSKHLFCTCCSSDWFIGCRQIFVAICW